MSKMIAPALTAGLLAWLLAAPVLADEDAGWWLGGSVTAATDYVFRGVSQTDESLAIQASVDAGHSSGLYAGVWASNVDFDAPDGIDTEVNLYVGWTFGFANESELDLQLVRYLYPGSNPGYGINYNELIAAYSFLDFFTASVAWSDSYVNSDESAFYYHLGTEWPLGADGLNLVLGAGYNDVSKLAGSDFWDYQVGIAGSWDMFTADLSYFDTSGFDAQVQDVFGPRAWADGRVVLTLTVEF